jgi:predicted small secreted protein
MKTHLRLFVVCVTAVLVTVSFSSCHTVRGVGQDVQQLGNKIERTAARHS